jgi:TonB-dependent receptor
MSQRNALRTRFLMFPVVSACAVTSATVLSAGLAYAEDIETVVVTGEQYAMKKSIEDKRDANLVSDGISADDIGSIPEFGLGDAIRKIPGLTLTINNGRGEYQFLTVRGLNPDYNSLTVDGVQLASSEETRRQVSLDILPAVLVSRVAIDKSWTVDQPSDAIGGVTALRSRSAFDHPGEFIDAHLDAAYWENGAQIRHNAPSGQGDFTYSRTFGPNNEFGFLVLGSYYRRSSSTLNTYTLGYSYYPYAGSGTVTEPALDQTGATATSATLKPSDTVAGTVPVPDRHRWYYYDNDRTRPGIFGRFDYDNHRALYAHISGGIFEHINNEDRYSQYLNRVGNVTITSPTSGSFAQGSPEVDYDRYVQYRQLTYVDVGGGIRVAPDARVDLTLNYGIGSYKQKTEETQFTAPAGTAYGFTYDLRAPTAPLFVPNDISAFMNPANYRQAYYLNAVDTSISHLPQSKLEFNYNMDGEGFGVLAGWSWRQMSQKYYYYQNRKNVAGTAPTLAQIGTINKNLDLYNGEGQTLLLIDPSAVENFVAANPSNYGVNANDPLTNTVNNFRLFEQVNALYGEVQYRWKDLYALAGVRYESTNQKISNYLPVPFSSTSNFVQTDTPAHYVRLLPSLNVSYQVTDTIKLRGAISKNLARPQYAQLAQNSSASLNSSGNTASESISNPLLKPRESTNYDLSAEWYPTNGVLGSVALFNKEIKNEIVTLSTTVPNATVPGYSNPVTLTITQAQNANQARVQGVEIGVTAVKFDFLPGFLSDFGGTANASFINMSAPSILMSDGSLRKLPQIMESSHFMANLSLLYSRGPYSGEIAYNYTSKMPLSFATNNAVNDQWWAGIHTLDSQIRYNMDENISFRFQMKNITNARPQKVVGQTQQLNYSTLDNGRAFYLGVAFVQ